MKKKEVMWTSSLIILSLAEVGLWQSIVFKTLFVVEPLLLLMFVVIRLLTVVIGLMDIRGVLGKGIWRC
ncbi:MAG: hypothetical protein LH478_14115 [Chitinophagaceae bacterium]|nr:hypothetical protein [Chitinophagaceae bacterium]